MRPFPEVNMQELMTPWDRAVVVRPGPVDATVLAGLIKEGFDQAPVVSQDGPVGLILRSELEALLAARRPVPSTGKPIIMASVSATAALDDVFDTVRQHGMACVVDRITGQGLGFCTLSDLNRHPVRVAIYPLFAEMESKLATLVDRHNADPWHWLKRLDEDKQARLIGYWELSKRRNVDVGPIAGMTLSELIKVTGCTEPLLIELGYKRKEWNDLTGGLVDMRNAVMHPVRPVFFSGDDVQKARDRLGTVLEVLDRLEDLWDEGRADGVQS